jgi:hypothetical protein
MLAIVRPDGWDLPLLVHVAGAMLLVGALVVVVAVTAAALRRGDDAAVLTRLAFRGLLIGVLPASIEMRSGSPPRSPSATRRGSASAIRPPTAACS